MIRLAPHLGMTSLEDGLFVHHAGADPLEQIAFVHDRGFAGVEDNFLQTRPPDVQARIGSALSRRGLTMGCFLATVTHDRPTFASPDIGCADLLCGEIRQAIDAAKRVGGRSLTMILGRAHPHLPRALQLQAAVDNLKRCAEIAERADVVLLVEPIARVRWADILVARVDEALALCQAVDSEAVRLLFDVYQCQCESGNLIATLDRAWDWVGGVQIADCPGRCEPGTGEINFVNVLRHLRMKRWDGLIELEHAASRPGLEGELAVLDVYGALIAETIVPFAADSHRRYD